MNLSAVFQQLRHTFPQHVRRRPLRYALSALSISAAAALFMSMRITQAALVHNIDANRDAINGDAEFAASGIDGVSADVLTALEQIEGVRAAPVVRGSVVVARHRESITILGIDPLRDAALRGYDLSDRITLDLPTLLTQPNAMTVPATLADRFGWSLRDTVTLVGPRGPIEFAVAGLITSKGAGSFMGGRIAVMSAPSARRLLGRAAGFDRIDIAIDPPATRAVVQAALPAGVGLQTLGERDPTFDYIHAQIQVLLGTVTAMALLIGAFIVFNAASLSVVERSKEIGTFRALGAQRGELLAVLVIEAAVVGLIASILGALAGRLTADLTLRQIAKTLSIIIEVSRLDVIVPPDAWVVAMLVGMGAAVAGTLSPAFTAVSMPPVATMRAGEVQRMRSRRAVWLILAAGPLAVAGCMMITGRHLGWGWTIGGMSLCMLAASLTGPALLAAIGPPLRWLAARSDVTCQLATDSVLEFPARTTLTGVAFGGSLCLIVAMSGMMSGLERDINTWMDDLFAFDLTASTIDMTASVYPTSAFPRELLDQAAADPRVLRVHGVRSRFVRLGGDDVMLIAYGVESLLRGRIDRGLSRNPERDMEQTRRLVAGDAVISENLAYFQELSPDDMMTLDTPSGPHAFRIAATRIDHSFFRGVILLDLDVYRRLWKDDSLSYIDIFLRPGADATALQADLTEQWSDRYGLFVMQTRQMKEQAIAVTREWLAVADGQILLAILIGGVGVANTLMMSILMQSRRIALLRAIGASARQIRRMLLLEAGGLGLLGGLAGCAMGMLVLYLVAGPVLLKAGGFSPQFPIPWRAMGLSVAAGILIAIGAAVLPLRAVRRLDIVQAIGYE
jgi:putative ABC transport system permease protein